MKQRSFLPVILVLCILGGAGCQGLKESERAFGPESDRTNTIDQGNETNDVRTVIVYYFHRTVRCFSCLTMEELSLEALTTGFEEGMQNGALEWVVVNIDDVEGAEFVEDFDLQTSSLVIAETRDGRRVRWKRLDKIWDLKDNRAAFLEYVQEQVGGYLASN